MKKVISKMKLKKNKKKAITNDEEKMPDVEEIE
jgi:hypothetical protein